MNVCNAIKTVMNALVNPQMNVQNVKAIYF